VLSRRSVLEEEREEKKKHTLQVLAEGMVLTGTVKNITDYGAFIDLGGIDGLLHVTDMSWGRVGHPSEIFQVGDQVEVVVLHFDRETGRVSLGYKQKSSDPWERVEKTYAAGTKTRGKVVSLTNYGAFIELEPGVEGLVHVSEMSWTRRVRHPSKLVNVGDEVEVIVLDVNRAAKRISLGMKQVEPDPWATIEERYRPGTRVVGRVRNLTDFGAFIELEPGVDGLLHISDMSWTRSVGHPSEILKKGQELETQILIWIARTSGSRSGSSKSSPIRGRPSRSAFRWARGSLERSSASPTSARSSSSSRRGRAPAHLADVQPADRPARRAGQRRRRADAPGHPRRSQRAADRPLPQGAGARHRAAEGDGGRAGGGRRGRAAASIATTTTTRTRSRLVRRRTVVLAALLTYLGVAALFVALCPSPFRPRAGAGLSSGRASRSWSSTGPSSMSTTSCASSRATATTRWSRPW
jgi:predicted RNA-binding protein with RPS1 domain